MGTCTPRMTDEPGVRFGLAVGAEIGSLLVTGTAGLGRTTAGTVLVLTTVLAGRVLGQAALTALGVIAWAFFTGFIENRFGVLTFVVDDVVRLALFVGATLFTAQLVPRDAVRSGPSD
jgi:hypothetical protein